MPTAPPPSATPKPLITELEWDRILTRIESGQVIPVVGEHLTTLGHGDEPATVSLAAHLGARILRRPGQPPASLNELALRYLDENPKGSEDLYADIFQQLRDGPFPVPTPLKQLAEIRAFNLFVNTSFDPYLAFALNEVRFGRRSSASTRVLAYEGNREVDLPERFRTLDYPLIYHIFGKAQAAPLFAVTDEDVLEFVHTLQAPECLPPRLSEALREQRLLVLGTRLTGWLARFFLRISSASRLRDARKADYLFDLNADVDADQALFFGRFGEIRLLPMPATRFVEELSTRWKARHPDLVAEASDAVRVSSLPPGTGEVFLSYASEDLRVVKALRERLEREAGVQVWLDRDALRGGDQWERRIADALRSCSVCVPVISRNVKAGPYRYVRTEWAEAVRLAPGKLANRLFIHPLLIDATSPEDPELDPDIRKMQWRRLADEEDMKLFVSEVRATAEGQV